MSVLYGFLECLRVCVQLKVCNFSNHFIVHWPPLPLLSPVKLLKEWTAEKTKIRYTHWPFWMDKREVKVSLETTEGSWMARGEMCCRSSVFIVYILCHPRSGQRLLFKIATALSQQWHICPVKWNGSIFFSYSLLPPTTFIERSRFG